MENFDSRNHIDNVFIPFLEKKVGINKEDLFKSVQLFMIENENDLDNTEDKMENKEMIEEFVNEFNDEPDVATMYFVLKQV